jgi:rhomboid domain-containing protein 1
MQILRVGADNLGPVSMAVLVVNIGLSVLDLDFLPWTEFSEVCIGAHDVWYRREYYRLITHAIFHVNSMHLYYNMSSFLFKGRLLERVMGSIQFAWLIMCFIIGSGMVLTASTLFLDAYFPQYNAGFSCAVGFSGVLFALNTILPFMLRSPEQSQIMGFQFPTKYVTLVELVMIHLLVPGSSFLGHLAGIFVGLMFVSRKFDFIFRMPELLWMTPPHQGNYQPQPPRNNGQMYVDENGVLRQR